MDSTDEDCYQFAYYNLIVLNFRDGTSKIVKLVAKLDDDVFCVWIKPDKLGTLQTNHGLGFSGTDIFIDNVKQPSVSMKRAVIMFLTFLKTSPKSVLLITISPTLPFNPLLQLFKKTDTLHLFYGVIAGFVNILPILKIRYSVISAMDVFTLPNLAHHLLRKGYAEPLYQSPYDVDILEELVTKKLLKDDLIQYRKPFRETPPSEKQHLRRMARAEVMRAISNTFPNETDSFVRARSPVPELPNSQTPDSDVTDPMERNRQILMDKLRRRWASRSPKE